jgi:hypothetical protein
MRKTLLPKERGKRQRSRRNPTIKIQEQTMNKEKSPSIK